MPRHATPHHITPHHTTPHHRCFVFSPSASSLSLLLTSAPHARSTPSLWALVISRSRVPLVPQRTNTDQTTATWFENLTLCLEPEHLSTMRRSHPLVLFALPQLRHTTICITPRLLPRMHFAGNATYGIAPIHSTGAQTTPSTSMSTSPRMSTQSSASPSSAQGGYEPTQMARINLRRMAELVGPSSVQCTHRHFRPLEIQLRDLRHNLRDHCADCQENVRHHTSSSADPTPHLTPNPSHQEGQDHTTPHSTLHTLHFTLHTSHSALHIPMHHTPHSTLHIQHSPLRTPHITHHTSCITHHTPHHIPHSTPHTPPPLAPTFGSARSKLALSSSPRRLRCPPRRPCLSRSRLKGL